MNKIQSLDQVCSNVASAFNLSVKVRNFSERLEKSLKKETRSDTLSCGQVKDVCAEVEELAAMGHDYYGG